MRRVPGITRKGLYLWKHYNKVLINILFY
jgi:hypothetical protein